MSPSLALASVFLRGGRCAAFFKPGDERLAADAEAELGEDAADPAQGAALVVGGQGLGLELGAVAAWARVVAAASLAVVAEILLLAVGGLAVTAQVDAAAVDTRDCLNDHAQSIQQTVYT